MEKIIEGIEPYNTLWFHTCFYNALFSCFSSFNIDPTWYMINYAGTYTFDKQDLFSIELYSSKSEKEILSNLGIDLRRERIGFNIVGAVKRSIDLKNPVIVWLDCINNPLQLDYYKKESHPHAMTVYGYNDNKEIFHVIEQSKVYNLDYKKKEISYYDLEKSCQTYLRNYYNKLDNNNFYSISGNKHIKFSCKQQKSILLENYKEPLGRNIDIIEKYIIYFIDEKRDWHEILENGEKYIKGLNKIIKQKNVELFLFNQLGINVQIELKYDLKSIIEQWEYIRVKIGRSLLRNHIDSIIINEIIKSLQFIYNIEKKVLT